MSILFKGDNKALIVSINALLALDAKGALAPHGIGEMARDLLETCAARLPTEQHQGEPVAWRGLNELGEVVTEWIDGAPPASMVDLSGNPASFARIESAYTHADPGEVERLREERDSFQRVGIKAIEQLVERDALLRDKSGDLIRMAAHLISAPLFALQELQDEDKKMTRARVDAAVDSADARLKDAAYELRRIADALSASAEPSAPVELDALTDLATWKRRAIEAESKLRTYDPQVVELGEQAMQALLAEPKPSELVLTKCRLCDQLQADLTERDQQIDALSMDAGRYRWLRSRDLETISKGGVFAGLTPDNLVLNEETLDHAIDAAMAKSKCRHCGDTGQIMAGRSGQAEDGNAPIIEPCEDCDRGMPDLASRPEERGTPETEPCSGCGTPGWTGACNKCVPY